MATLEELEEKIASIENSIEVIKQTCPLGPYKNEMKERCKRFSDSIANNEKCITSARHIAEKNLKNAEDRCLERHKYTKTIFGRMISSAIILAVCLVSIIGALQLTKVSRSEFQAHLDNYTMERKERAAAFDKFMTTYTYDRDRRDNKIDALFARQVDFNASMMKQNALLSEQLHVIKARLDADK